MTNGLTGLTQTSKNNSILAREDFENSSKKLSKMRGAVFRIARRTAGMLQLQIGNPVGWIQLQDIEESIMKKHCPKCKMDIEDIMGIWNCLVCNTLLELGWIRQGKATFFRNRNFATIKNAIQNKYCWHCQCPLEMNKKEFENYGYIDCKNEFCKAHNMVKL